MLLFGKQYTKKNKNKIGGVIKLFELFKTELQNNKVDFEVIDLNWRNYSNPVVAYLYIYSASLFKIKKHSSISFHGTANEYIYIAPVIVFISKLFKKKVSLRKFAGNFDLIFQQLNKLQRYLVRYSLENSDIVFWETLHLVDYFKIHNPNTHWFPNVRPPHSIMREGEYKKRFIFVGQVKNTKGVNIILESFNSLDETFSIDFYGPIEDNNFLKNCEISPLASYQGVLDTDNVAITMSNYDVLLLPTFHPGEGYPGVILEAFSCGLPVIASNWGGIAEMVINECDGYVIKPNNIQELTAAIEKINKLNFIDLSINATKSFNKFDSNIVTRKLIKLI